MLLITSSSSGVQVLLILVEFSSEIKFCWVNSIGLPNNCSSVISISGVVTRFEFTSFSKLKILKESIFSIDSNCVSIMFVENWGPSLLISTLTSGHCCYNFKNNSFANNIISSGIFIKGMIKKIKGKNKIKYTT